MTQYINNQNVERLKEFSYERYDWLMGVAVGQAQDEVSSVMWGTVGGTGAPQSRPRYECWRFCNYTGYYTQLCILHHRNTSPLQARYLETRLNSCRKNLKDERDR